ncbi:MAG: preprotein translocase subunit SecA, partial [Chlamydiia bacterium]|nr:preprotein translocase subunit SecA [Chlamydiia bacterium]
MFRFLRAIFGTAQDRKVRRYRHMVREIRALEEKLKPLSDDQLRAKTLEFKERYRSGESLDALLPEAYAVVVEACRRFCGTEVHVSGYDQKWDMIPYDVQLVGAIAMYHGNIAEMMTGEGKTLTAILPLYLNALSGRPVHLVTVNDYLAERDCQWVGSILRWLGLTTGALTSATPTQARKDLYRCDVLYGTASEFGFDYLRDNSMAMRAEEQVQSGHYFVIIDEIDSILIDEARTPLIISGPSNRSYQKYAELHPGVAALVRLQRDYCNKLASEVRKEINIPQDQEGIQFTKEERARLEPAFRKLWLVSKGMPNNRTLKRLREEPEIRAELDQVDLYFHGDQNKEERHDFLAELYIIVDERANEYELTDKGIIAWENCAPSDIKSEAFTMLDLSHEYIQIDGDSSLSDSEKMQRKLEVQAEDAERKEIAHNLRQLLRAQLLMECDVDYIIQEGKIVIIDEHTGRAQPGRRFSDGLHQAIEAKEGVKIQEETQTYATITLQNYFRMYEKRSGMTGTAMTEANEFKEIYKL